jgi:carboxylesterase type B
MNRVTDGSDMHKSGARGDSAATMSWVTRRVLCSLAALAMAADVGTAASGQAPSAVRVDGGDVQGVVADGVESFKGIPFAAPPVGELRWRPPQPAAAWTGVRQASEFGADCMQGRFGPPPAPGAPPARMPSEDCLFLNVWRPAGAATSKLPVMVWIYGGGFMGGSGASAFTSGMQFAKQGVVLVSLNYRVGRFGFFAFPALSSERPDEPKSNYAYMDQIAALQWVKRNIAAFGGDPANVTIFGFSAGGVSVHSLVASPMARGLFHKAIAQSGGSRDSVLTARPLRADGVDPNYPVSAETLGATFARSMGIEGTDATALTSLRALTSEQVLRGAPAPAGTNPPQVETTPILDGKLITETAETAYKARRQPRIPLLLGSNSADTAGNRIRATTKDEIWAVECASQSGVRPRRHGRPAGDDREGQRRLRPGRAGPLCRECVCGQRLAGLSLPVLLRPGGHAGTLAGRGSARRRDRLRVRYPVARTRLGVDARGSSRLAHGPELLGQLREDRRSERCRPAGVAPSRSQEGCDLRLPPRWLRGCRPRSAEGAARRHAVGD